MFAVPDDHYDERDQSSKKNDGITQLTLEEQECLKNLGQDDGISIELREKLCKIINGVKSDSDSDSTSSVFELMDLWYNDIRVLEELRNIFILRGLRITPEICLVIKKIKQEERDNYHYMVDANDGELSYNYSVLVRNHFTIFNPENFRYFYIDHFLLREDLFAIPFGFQGEYGSHANMLICRKYTDARYDKPVIECEHFEPHGQYFIGNIYKDQSDFIINRVFELLHLLFDPNEYKIIVLNPNQICPKEVKKLQSLTHSEWGGSCTLFSLWYMFLRLLNPSRSRSDNYHLMVKFLKSVTDPNDILREIVSTFVSLLNINLNDFTVNDEPFLEETKNEIVEKRKMMRGESVYQDNTKPSSSSSSRTRTAKPSSSPTRTAKPSSSSSRTRTAKPSSSRTRTTKSSSSRTRTTKSSSSRTRTTKPSSSRSKSRRKTSRNQ